MQPLRVILVSPGDAPRRALEERIRDLGHDVLGSADPGGDLVVADLRETDATNRRAPWPGDDGLPMLALLDETALTEGVLGRRSGMVLAIGAAGEAALEVALRVCAALRRGDLATAASS